MTIAPEPSRRMRARSVRLGIENVSQDIVERAARAPARRRAQLRRVTHQIRPRLTAHLAGISLVLRGDTDQLLKSRMNFLQRDGSTRSDVVHLSRQDRKSTRLNSSH